MNARRVLVSLAAAAWLPAVYALSWDQMRPFLRQHDLVYEKAPLEWNQGIPLGNGFIGGLIWGSGEPLKITLDRNDVWEARYQTSKDPRHNYKYLRELIGRGDYDLANRIFYRDIYNQGPSPTRLPMGKAIIDCGPGAKNFTARLNLAEARAEGTWEVEGGKVSFSSFIPPHTNVIVVEMNLEGAAALRDFKALPANVKMKSLGYPPPETGQQGRFSWWRQPMTGNENYLIMWTVERVGPRRSVGYITIASHRDSTDSLGFARATLEKALQQGPAVLYAQHRAWWTQYWLRSYLTIPDARLENLFYVEMYKLGSLSRPGGLPIALQGLWTTDNVMPPWNGDYHLDMNVQESYWPVYASNHLDAGVPLYEMVWNMMPRLREQCRKFFGVEGAFSYPAIDWRGAPIQCWITTAYWPGSGPWVAQHFWLHYLYSQDKEFLRNRAYPVMRDFMDMYMGILEHGEDGFLHVPLTTSPEWANDELAAWGSDSTCDLALIRFLGKALLQTVEILKVDDPKRSRWLSTLEQLAPYPRDGKKDIGPTYGSGINKWDQGGLSLLRGVSLTQSQRHHAHLMPIYPLGLLTTDGTAEDRDLIEKTINRWIWRGTGEWTGWSFPWASLIASRVGKPNMAHDFLRRYMDAFVTDNTFHINGDPKEFGYAMYRYSPMTLEGGFAAAAAVMEMLLQSWDGKIRLFPVLPRGWRDAAFVDLRAEGAFLVTSRLHDRHVVFAEILSEQGGTCRVVNPWPESEVTLANLTRQEFRSLGKSAVLQWQSEKGARYRLTRRDASPAPKDLGIPVPSRGASDSNWWGVKRWARF